MNYKPNDLPAVGEGLNAYDGMLERSEWERLAAFIVKESQKQGRWLCIDIYPAERYNGMLGEGLLTYNEGYTLTSFAIQKIKACQNSRSGRI